MNVEEVLLSSRLNESRIKKSLASLTDRHPISPYQATQPSTREAGRQGQGDSAQVTAREHGAGQHQAAGPRGALPDS